MKLEMGQELCRISRVRGRGKVFGVGTCGVAGLMSGAAWLAEIFIPLSYLVALSAAATVAAALMSKLRRRKSQSSLTNIYFIPE
jgi:hypothetical protein